MIRPMRVFARMFHNCLVLVLVLAMAQVTPARGQAGTIATWVELCVGDDVLTIAVDAQGQPVQGQPDRGHLHCPDCIMAGVALVSTGPVIAAPMQWAVADLQSDATRFNHRLVMLAAAARGPPVFV
ncbi:MAG: hypothetical protein RLZZ437_274 [Pseudomonadota bacterium]|jgi:hypothetical protein